MVPAIYSERHEFLLLSVGVFHSGFPHTYFPHLHFQVPSWASLVPILTEIWSVPYILPDHFEAFQTLDLAAFLLHALQP